ncbi:D-threo-aldose 1-dehydrogenase [Arboricoccus pini]|uniref:D-threo-aldose 1-dehydrogenase n=1 Tax=Arboricoccus pini TaxID=1963835 RepID=A0A212RCV4_9PROT|nr:aldo/keto reductase [Arboricoccus pini]SNB70102.1 D-threo-aldose 1-dehydrogenase [Arboricoccus pini]
MALSLETRAVGRTGLDVPVLGLGGAPLGDIYAKLPEDQALATIENAYAAGIRLFDTAPLYGHGLSEHRFGHVLRTKPRDSYILSTKVGRWLEPAAPGTFDRGQWQNPLNFRLRVDYSYDGAMRAIDQSLQRLGIERIDIAFIHDLDIWTHGSREVFETHYKTAVEGAFKALARLREEGVIKALGLGVNEIEPCVRFARDADPDLFMLAGRYTLLEQGGLDDLFPLAEAKGFSFFLAGPFNSGILATGAVPGAKYNYQDAPPEILDRVREIEAVCARHGVRLPAAAIRFPLGHPRIAAIIPGAVRPAEVEANIELMTAALPPDLWTDLRAAGLLREGTPVPA